MNIGFAISEPATVSTQDIPSKTTFTGVINGERALYLKTIERIVNLSKSEVKDGRTYQVTDYKLVNVNIVEMPF